MKKILIPLLVAFIFFPSCKNTSEKDRKEENTLNENSVPTLPETVKLCFLTTGEDLVREDRVIRDSTILTLQLEGEKATGTFNWFPAEKDGRSGTVEGTLSGDVIKGKYTFMQEGMTETQDVRIELTATEARITTNPGKEGEFLLTAEKTDCED